MEATGFVTDTELNSYINASYAELYDLLVSKYGEDYFVAPAHSISTTSNVDTYPLPADFYKLLGVDLQFDPSSWKSLKRFEFNERNLSQTWQAYSPEIMCYRIFGSNILLSQMPTDSLSLRVWYIPLPSTLTTDSDSFSGINGFEEYVVIDAAIKMLTKEESDTSQLLMQKQAIKFRIEQMAEARDASMPMTVQDTSSLSTWNYII
jgi:hypothetical protein